VYLCASNIRINSDYFRKQQLQLILCNADNVWFPVAKTEFILTLAQLDEFQFSNGKILQRCSVYCDVNECLGSTI
jgi:hypothetical protein